MGWGACSGGENTLSKDPDVKSQDLCEAIVCSTGADGMRAGVCCTQPPTWHTGNTGHVFLKGLRAHRKSSVVGRLVVNISSIKAARPRESHISLVSLPHQND